MCIKPTDLHHALLYLPESALNRKLTVGQIIPILLEKVSLHVHNTCNLRNTEIPRGFLDDGISSSGVCPDRASLS